MYVLLPRCRVALVSSAERCAFSVRCWCVSSPLRPPWCSSRGWRPHARRRRRRRPRHRRRAEWIRSLPRSLRRPIRDARRRRRSVPTGPRSAGSARAASSRRVRRTRARRCRATPRSFRRRARARRRRRSAPTGRPSAAVAPTAPSTRARASRAERVPSAQPRATAACSARVSELRTSALRGSCGLLAALGVAHADEEGDRDVRTTSRVRAGTSGRAIDAERRGHAGVVAATH